MDAAGCPTLIFICGLPAGAPHSVNCDDANKRSQRARNPPLLRLAVFIADQNYDAIRVITLLANGNTYIQRVAGQGNQNRGIAGNGGPSLDSLVNDPRTVALSPDGCVRAGAARW